MQKQQQQKTSRTQQENLKNTGKRRTLSIHESALNEFYYDPSDLIYSKINPKIRGEEARLEGKGEFTFYLKVNFERICYKKIKK